MQLANQILKKFWKMIALKIDSFENLIKSNTCFKSKPRSCVDLILTNKPKKFSKHRSDTEWHK